MLDLIIPAAHAQAANAAQGPSLLGSLLFPVLMIVVFYFILIRPQMKRAKEHRNMVAELKAGDEVLTNSGFYGRIKELEGNDLELELADNIVIRMQKGAVASVLPKGTIKK